MTATPILMPIGEGTDRHIDHRHLQYPSNGYSSCFILDLSSVMESTVQSQVFKKIFQYCFVAHTTFGLSVSVGPVTVAQPVIEFDVEHIQENREGFLNLSKDKCHCNPQPHQDMEPVCSVECVWWGWGFQRTFLSNTDDRAFFLGACVSSTGRDSPSLM